MDQGVIVNKLRIYTRYAFWAFVAVGAVAMLAWFVFAGCGTSQGDTGTGEAQRQQPLQAMQLTARMQEVPTFPGGSEEETGEDDSGTEVEEDEGADEEPAPSPQPQPDHSGDNNKNPAPAPSPPTDNTPTAEPRKESEPKDPTPKPPQPKAGPGVPTAPPPPPAPPPKPPEEPGIALCAPSPVTRADGTVGKFWQAGASQVPDLLKQGYTAALYVEGVGTTCSLSDAGVNPNDFVLDSSVIYTDGGMACPAAQAAAMCGDSAIHPFYRKKSR